MQVLKTKYTVQKHGELFVLENVKRILFKVVQQATNLKAVSGQKGIARLSNVSESYTKNKTRKWELNRGTAMQVDKEA